MGGLTLAPGGMRGGTSRLAERLAGRPGGEAVVSLASATATDDEMAARIARHRAERPGDWAAPPGMPAMPHGSAESTSTIAPAASVSARTLPNSLSRKC